VSILVFGSIVLDFLAVADELPKTNETVVTSNLSISPGGKGANQALAASRFGSDVFLVSKVGNDNFADCALEILKNSTIDLSHISTSNTHTAIGLLHASRQGDTQILVAAGALNFIKHDDIEDDLFKRCRTLLCQTELSFNEVAQVVQRAEKFDCNIVVNLCSREAYCNSFIKSIDYLIVNEAELNILAHFMNVHIESNLTMLIQSIFDVTGVNIIVTIGDRGSFYCNNQGIYYVPTTKVDPIDPAGAGDAFCGTFSSGIDLGLSDLEALRYASAAGALVCNGIGAQRPLANRDEVIKFSRRAGPIEKII
jgi:ribokinase